MALARSFGHATPRFSRQSSKEGTRTSRMARRSHCRQKISEAQKFIPTPFCTHPMVASWQFAATGVHHLYCPGLAKSSIRSALDFAWASKENDKDYAIRESQYSVKIYRNFKPKAGDGSVNVGYTADGLSGGTLLGVKGQGGIGFFDWETAKLVRRVEVEPKHVYWSESGELVCLACEDTFYVLRYSREQYVAAVQSGNVDEDGVEDAFEVVCDINER